MILPLLLVGCAMTLWPPMRSRYRRRRWQVPLLPLAAALLVLFAWPSAWPLAVLVAAVGLGRQRWVARRAPGTDLVQLPIHLELIGHCLRAGVSVDTAVASVQQAMGDRATDRLLAALSQAAGLLAIGADPQRAWQPVAAEPELAGLAAAALRSAHGGAGLAEAFGEQAALVRAAYVQRRGMRGAKAAVAVTAPLGVCFLPAFICLGLAPVVIGLVSSLTLW